MTTVDVPSISETVAVTGSNSTNYSGYFNSDNSLYSVYNDSNVVKLRRADFTITYNAGSGTGTVPSAATKYNNVDFTAIDATYPLTMDGYTQVGWKLNAESFDGQGAVTTLTANEAIALYPVWAINTYQVKLTDNDTGITGFKYRIDAANDSALWITYNEQFTVNHGQKLEIQAILDSNYIFEKWTTGITINPYTISGVTALINYTPTSIFVTKETKPSASFLATDADKGVLSNVSSGMKYKIDSGEWQTITGTIVNLTDMHSCVITIYQPGNGTTTIDSEEQTITVTKAVQPNLTQTQPAIVNGKGSIPTTNEHEYKTTAAWENCDGELDNLDAGTYYVRVKANGTVLASESQILTITPFIPAINAGIVITDTINGPDAPQATLNNDADELAEDVLTDAEKTTVSEGTDAIIYLVIDDISNTVSDTDKNLILRNVKTGTKLVYLDVSLFKKVGDNEPEKITKTNKKIRISVKIPEALINKDNTKNREYSIIRIHEGVATVIEGTYDENTKLFSFDTDAFSTYALAYTDEDKSGTTDTNKNPGQSTTPQTSDNTPIERLFAFTIISGAAFVFLNRKKKCLNR